MTLFRSMASGRWLRSSLMRQVRRAGGATMARARSSRTEPPLWAHCRPYHISSRLQSFGGSDLQSEMMSGGSKVTVTGYSDTSFFIDDVEHQGAVVVLPSKALLFNVKRVEDITLESLQLLLVADPPLDLLFLGTENCSRVQLRPEVAQTLDRHGIGVEITNPSNALATFNILNAEDRSVAAILFPEAIVERNTVEDVFLNRMFSKAEDDPKSIGR